jgi:hypothetical protein
VISTGEGFIELAATPSLETASYPLHTEFRTRQKEKKKTDPNRNE